MNSTTKPDGLAREMLRRLRHFVDQRNALTAVMRMHINDVLNYGNPGGTITVLDSLTVGSRIINDDDTWVKVADDEWEMQNTSRPADSVVINSHTLAYNLNYRARFISGEVLDVVSFD